MAVVANIIEKTINIQNESDDAFITLNGGTVSSSVSRD